MRSIAPLSRAPRSASAASIGSSGSPSVRAKTLVEPPGSTPSAASEPTRPLAASFRVPSPPSTTTASAPRSTPRRARAVAWWRLVVIATDTSWCVERILFTTTRVRGDTEDAEGLTIRSSFRFGSSPEPVPVPRR